MIAVSSVLHLLTTKKYVIYIRFFIFKVAFIRLAIFLQFIFQLGLLCRVCQF